MWHEPLRASEALGARAEPGPTGTAAATATGDGRLPEVSGRPRRLAIDALIQSRDRSQARIDAFIAEHDFPIVEGPACTFVFRGAADSVRLRHWIYGLPSSQPFHALPGTELWYLTIDLPAGSRVEYKLELTVRGDTRWIQDPLNPLLARDPFGANSVCHATGYEVPAWTQPDPDVRQGSVEERSLRSTALGGERMLTLYLPARYRSSRSYPLLIVHDGPDYLEFASMKTVLDNLIHRLEIPGLVAAFTHPEERLVEYADNAAHAEFITAELVPHLEAELPLRGTPESRAVVGASFGAVAAFSNAVRHPGFYGRLLLQSGSFAFSDIGDHARGPLFDPVVELMNRYRAEPIAMSRKVFVSCGKYESPIYENRSLVPVLQGTGMDIRYVEAPDGHNWENWRDRLREGLSWLFPGPLWMVYE